VSAAAHDVRVLQDGAALQDLLPEWEELSARCGQGFASLPSYGLSWFRALGRGTLAVTAVRRGGRLVAVAPLHRRAILGQDVLRWLGHGLGTVGELVTEDVAAATAVWDHLLTTGSALQLTHVRLDDVGTLALRRSRGWRVRVRVDDRCPTLPLPVGTTAASVRGKRSLTRLTRYRNALQTGGRPFAVEVVTDVAGLRAHWPEVVAVAAAADEGRGRTNLCAPPWDRFTLPFLEQEAQAGRLRLVGATAGGRWCAHEVGLLVGGTLHLWLSRFDPRLRGVSPGHLLAVELVDRAADLGVDGLDFGLGENDYKLAWADGGYDVGSLSAVPADGPALRARAALAGSGLRAALRQGP
jgi:CelD/BcsL family acetyltransferase involved in cellulose biosynthesis